MPFYTAGYFSLCSVSFVLFRRIYHITPYYYSLSEKLVAAFIVTGGECGAQTIADNSNKTDRPGSNNMVRTIPHITHGGCESSTPTWGVFSCNYECFSTEKTTGKTENSCSGLTSNFSPIAFQQLIFLYLSLYSFENFVVKTVVLLYFLHKKCHAGRLLSQCLCWQPSWKAWA